MTDSMLSKLLRFKIFRVSIFGATVLFFAGIIFWGGFNTFMEATNTLRFCVACHEMESTVYQEYKQSVHYQNGSGVRAICSDCHVPDSWIYKFVRKIKATNELFHWANGTIDTPEKFEAKRLTLAKLVWKDMKETDSRECRNCHSWQTMAEKSQRRRAWKKHQQAQSDGMTCIDCHKGLAHRPVHKLLTEDDDPYDGKPDPRRLPMASVQPKPVKASPKPALAKAPAPRPTKSAPVAAAPIVAAKSAPAAAGAVDWAAVSGREIVLFYPGQASWEWMIKGSDHGGARAIKKLSDPCAECHKNEQADMGAKIVSGKKAEAKPIPGKRGSIKLTVKAAHDDKNLYMRFQWPDAGHTPAPFAAGGKMDPENKIKLAMMFDNGKVENANSAGCWATCHHDSRYMPDHPDAAKIAAAGDAAKRLDLSVGVTKYLKETRTEIEVRGSDGKPRGGWNKLKPAEEITALKKAGAFMELVRFKSGKGGQSETGYVLEQRIMEGGGKVVLNGNLADGKWTVDMIRPLKAGRPGYVTFEPGKLYTVGFAIHDDYTAARFHHVSLEYTLGLDNAEAAINAIKR